MLIQKHELKQRVTLFLFSVVFAGLSAGVVFAQDDQSRLTPTPSSNAVVKANHAEDGAPPELRRESKEHGLTPEPVEVGNLLGLPITNSMIVTWITALGLIVFANIATRCMKPVPAAKAILAEARETATREHERMLAQLKREIGRLVVETTAAVTGKILTTEDQQRLAEETAKQFAG